MLLLLRGISILFPPNVQKRQNLHHHIPTQQLSPVSSKPLKPLNQLNPQPSNRENHLPKNPTKNPNSHPQTAQPPLLSPKNRQPPPQRPQQPLLPRQCQSKNPLKFKKWAKNSSKKK